jgi:hypothetical protein
MTKESWETVAPIDRERMLTLLNRQGHDAGSDFNDGEEVSGWFGWDIANIEHSPLVLEVTYTPTTEEGDGPDDAKAVTRCWRLEPID